MNGFASYQIFNIIKKMSDSGKQQLLHNQEFIEKYQIADYELKDIVYSLTDEARAETLADRDLIVDKLHLQDFQIVELVKGLSSEEAKSKMFGIYQLSNYQKIDIINTFNVSSRLDILLSEESFSKYDRMQILKTLDVKTLSEFFIHHKEFFDEHDIHPYEIICKLDT